jgi:hypothetical protein
MQSPARVGKHGILLGISMFFYSGAALGAFQHFFLKAAIVWMVLLVVAGVLLRRHLWTTNTFAFSVLGFGLLTLILVYLAIGLSLGSSFLDSLRMVGEIQGPWFYAPLVLGFALGSIRKRQAAEGI